MGIVISKLHLRDVNSSGISTAYTQNSYAVAHKSIAVSSFGADGTGSLWYQQVQTSGDA